jgi:hypothetical protein
MQSSCAKIESHPFWRSFVAPSLQSGSLDIMPDGQSAENPGTSERRLHPRKQLLFPWIQWGANNGGIILDISESGLAMRPVRSLADGESSAMRFQLSESETLIETRGRIAWISASKKTAGVEFVGLPEEARNKIREWIPLTLHPSGSAEEKPVIDVLPTREPETAISINSQILRWLVKRFLSHAKIIARFLTIVAEPSPESRNSGHHA